MNLKAHLAFRVYNHIHSFFERYYRDGDFGYNDRSTTQYKVDYPDEANYDGTDTLFHWKCRDSYYVKTATGFNSVTFEVEDKRIEYRLEGKASFPAPHKTVTVTISNTTVLIELNLPNLMMLNRHGGLSSIWQRLQHRKLRYTVR